MQLFKVFAVLSLAVFTVVSASSNTTTRRLSLNPPASVLKNHKKTTTTTTQLEARHWTNANRLKEGLPLNPPRRRTRLSVDAASPQPSPATLSQGFIQVSQGSTVLGFIQNTLNSFGEYGMLTSSTANALRVSVDRTRALNTPTNILTTNGPNSAFGYLGGTQGFASNSPDINTGSSNYLYLDGTVQTPVGSTPVIGGNTFTAATSIAENIESAIWQINSNGVITPMWVNRNTNTPTGFVGYDASDQLIFITGDETAFQNQFGTFPFVTLTFVPA